MFLENVLPMQFLIEKTTLFIKIAAAKTPDVGKKAWNSNFKEITLRCLGCLFQRRSSEKHLDFNGEILLPRKSSTKVQKLTNMHFSKTLIMNLIRCTPED